MVPLARLLLCCRVLAICDQHTTRLCTGVGGGSLSTRALLTRSRPSRFWGREVDDGQNGTMKGEGGNVGILRSPLQERVVDQVQAQTPYSPGAHTPVYD